MSRLMTGGWVWQGAPLPRLSERPIHGHAESMMW